MVRTTVRLSHLEPHSGRGRPDRERGLIEALARFGVDCVWSETPAPQTDGTLLLADPGRRELLPEIRRQAATSRRLLVVGSSAERAARGAGWACLAAGAADLLFLDNPAATAQAVAARLARWQEIDRLLDLPVVSKNLIGQSRAWRSALAQIAEAARFGDSAVLLGGESGTGKELVARLIHTLDPRSDKRELILLDCTTVHAELSGSEFFGHERGAFTNAAVARDGAFALADCGTLFLDEVGELPPRLQAELLRVVQEGTFKRIGSNQWQQTRFRLVCASHRDLLADVEAGRFRRDLYYRLAGSIYRLPSLSERREDVPLLARHFLAERCGEAPEIDPEVLAWLEARDYPGNVRDLRQLVGRIAHRHVGPGPITLGDVPTDERPTAELPPEEDEVEAGFDAPVLAALARGQGLKEISNQVGDTAVRLALEQAEGNLRRAAEKLGVTDRALQMRRAAKREEGA